MCEYEVCPSLSGHARLCQNVGAPSVRAPPFPPSGQVPIPTNTARHHATRHTPSALGPYRDARAAVCPSLSGGNYLACLQDQPQECSCLVPRRWLRYCSRHPGGCRGPHTGNAPAYAPLQYLRLCLAPRPRPYPSSGGGILSACRWDQPQEYSCLIPRRCMTPARDPRVPVRPVPRILVFLRREYLLPKFLQPFLCL
jgi:hypothetical protein